jgi:hypothetical protein
MIMADVRGKFGGSVVRLVVADDGSATGHFIPGYASFMPLRHTLDLPIPGPIWETDDTPMESVSELDPALLQSNHEFNFVAQWHFVAQGHPPGVTWSPTTEDGKAGVHLRAPDGSRASVYGAKANGGFLVSQAGPRRLWDRMEEAYTFWQQTGRPTSDRFGITATTTEQYVWFDHPGSEHRWPLPTPTTPELVFDQPRQIEKIDLFRLLNRRVLDSRWICDNKITTATSL